MQIKKVKITGEEKIRIEFLQDEDEFSLVCSDNPAPSFFEALKGLVKYVVEMCELPDDYLDRISVKGVTFSYSGKEETMGATIIAQMKLFRSNVNLNLNTPHKTEGSYSGTEADLKQLLPEGCVEALGDVIEAAADYIEGKRAQLGLF